MLSFREHVVDRYFGYRRQYVDHILSVAPQRARLAVLSEVTRLAFVIFGSALCALIFWLLVAAAAQRRALPLLALFVVAALAATAGGALAASGFWRALRDRARVAAQRSR